MVDDLKKLGTGQSNRLKGFPNWTRERLLRGLGPRPELTEKQVQATRAFEARVLAFAHDIFQHIAPGPIQSEILDTLRNIQTKGRAVIAAGRVVLYPETLEQFFHVIEERDHLVTHLVLHHSEYADVRKHAKDLDYETQAASLKKGLQGRLWGAQIWTLKNMPPHHILLVSSEREPPTFSPTWTPDPAQLINLLDPLPDALERMMRIEESLIRPD